MKKKILLCSLFVLSLLMISVFAVEGEGTEESPFLITTQEELMLVSDFPDCDFKLMNDIVLEGEWIPLCTYGDAFSGTFDGNGYTISNLGDDTEYNNKYLNVGLFASNCGTIKNLTVVTSDNGLCLRFGTKNDTNIGFIVGMNDGNVINCSAEGNIDYINGYKSSQDVSYYVNIGGICGTNNKIIENSFVKICTENIDAYRKDSNGYCGYGTVSFGGVAGRNNGKINRCVAENKVTGVSTWGSYVGGIAGRCEEDNSITDCAANGELSAGGSGNSLGGIIGTNSGKCDISNSYFIGIFSESGAICHVGGIVGYEYGTTNITNCYACLIDETRSRYYSGIVGFNESSTAPTVTNCFYDQTVSGATDTECGTPKSTMAMKMKATYTGWDFENVWGISPDINDGYPYLLWDYADEVEPDEPSEPDKPSEPTEPSEPEEKVASVSIVKAESTANALTMVSCVNIIGDYEIESFGTTFIPLWLLTSADAEILNIEHNNADYDISNGDVYSATITGIPEGYDDMVFVGKSYLKMADGEYVWSTAKSASIAENTLHKVVQ